MTYIQIMQTPKPNIPAVDPYLFWDVDQESMDWRTESSAAWILERVVERGGKETDFAALVDFYGLPLLRKVGREMKDLRFPFMAETLSKLLGLNPNEMQCYVETRSRAERLISLWS